jgi:hypothetical protein
MLFLIRKGIPIGWLRILLLCLSVFTVAIAEIHQTKSYWLLENLVFSIRRNMSGCVNGAQLEESREQTFVKSTLVHAQSK